MLLAGAVALAACASGATLGESKQPASGVTVQALPSALATRVATPVAATHTAVPGKLSAGRSNETTPVPLTGPTPTTVAGQAVELSGTIESIDGGTLVVGGRTVIVSDQTEVQSVLQIGLVVTVQGTLQSDGSILAREIKD